MRTSIGFLLILVGVLVANTAFAAITEIIPSRGFPGQIITTRVLGNESPKFTSVSAAKFSGTDITVTGTNFVSSAEIHVTFKIDSTATPGSRTLTITPGGDATFTIAPVIGEAPEERIPRTVVGANEFIDLLRTITDWFFVVVLVGAVVFVVLAGWQFISGGGDPQQVSQARNKLLWAAAGIGVAVLARGLVEAVRSLIGS